MLKLLFITILLCLGLNVSAQLLPDSVIVSRQTYTYNLFKGEQEDKLYATETYKFIKTADAYICNNREVPAKVVENLLRLTADTTFRTLALHDYGIDTNWIKQHPAEMLALTPQAKYFGWNDAQKTLAFKSLTNVSNYQAGLENYIKQGCCYTMHQNYRYDFKLGFYTNSKLTGQLRSRKFIWGVAYPWTNENGQLLYDARIDRVLTELLEAKMIKQPLNGKALLKQLAKQVMEANESALHKLAPLSYEKEINELRGTFHIVAGNEISSYGGYHGDGGQIQVILHSPQMPDSVNIEFLASKTGSTIYPRDSVLHSYKAVVERVKSIRFLMEHLASHREESLHILFFNDRNINDYNIKNVNTYPAQWKAHDAYVKSLGWYAASNIKPSFDLNEAIKIAEQNDCGCNLRLSPDFIKKSIMFVINEYGQYNSRWLLLPDDRVLEFATTVGALQLKQTKNLPTEYCLLFDLNGHVLPKPKFP